MTTVSCGTLLRWQTAMLPSSTILCSSLRFSLPSFTALTRSSRHTKGVIHG